MKVEDALKMRNDYYILGKQKGRCEIFYILCGECNKKNKECKDMTGECDIENCELFINLKDR